MRDPAPDGLSAVLSAVDPGSRPVFCRIGGAAPELTARDVQEKGSACHYLCARRVRLQLSLATRRSGIDTPESEDLRRLQRCDHVTHLSVRRCRADHLPWTHGWRFWPARWR